MKELVVVMRKALTDMQNKLRANEAFPYDFDVQRALAIAVFGIRCARMSLEVLSQAIDGAERKGAF